jgi:hypothetical protein
MTIMNKIMVIRYDDEYDGYDAYDDQYDTYYDEYE